MSDFFFWFFPGAAELIHSSLYNSQRLGAATKLLVLPSSSAPCISVRTTLWGPGKNGANMMAVLTRAVLYICMYVY